MKKKKKFKRKLIIVSIVLLIPILLITGVIFISASIFQGHFGSDALNDNLDTESSSKLKQIMINKIEKINNDNTFDEEGNKIGSLCDYYGIDKSLKLTWPYVQAYIKYIQLGKDSSNADYDKTLDNINEAVEDLKPKFVYEKRKIITKSINKSNSGNGKNKKATTTEQDIYVLKKAVNVIGTYEIEYKLETITNTNEKSQTTVTKPVISGFRQIDSQYDPLKSIIINKYPDEDIDQALDGIITLVQSYLGEPIGKEMYYTGSGTFTGIGEAFTGGEKEFVNKISIKAIEAYKKYHILPSITIAQAIIESGWGKSGLTKKANNLFGIKAFSDWKGGYVDMLTTEYDDSNVAYKTIQRFRAYSSWDESIDDHSTILMQNNFSAVRSAKNYVEAAKALKAGGYALDPNYDTTIIQYIREYSLDKYDNR